VQSAPLSAKIDQPAINGRHSAAELEIDHLLPVLHGETIGKYRNRLRRLGCHRGKRGSQLVGAAGRKVNNARFEAPRRFLGIGPLQVFSGVLGIGHDGDAPQFRHHFAQQLESLAGELWPQESEARHISAWPRQALG
jgi:hypothetical protein